MKKKIRILLTMLIAMAACFGFSIKAQAATISAQVEGAECYRMAFEVLDGINEERTSQGLGTLTMDKTLMEAAMQRASECAVNYSHTRPDGTSCFTVITEYGFTYTGSVYENIAAGQTSASSAVTDWINSPGHYANLTQAKAVSTGVGVFSHGGHYYWVQLFSETAAKTAVTVANYSSSTLTKTKTVNILSTSFKPYGVVAGYSNYDYFPYGKTAKYYIRMNNMSSDVSSYYCQFKAEGFTWSSSNTSVLTVDSAGNLTGVGCGTATITGKISGTTVFSFTLSCYISMDDVTINGFYTSYPYTGSAIEPASAEEFSITYNGTILKEGTDYTVSYEDNTYTTTSATWACMYITGMGSYSGTLTKKFEIEKIIAKDNAVVTLAEREVGADETAEEYISSILTVKLEDRILVQDRDFYLEEVESYTSYTTGVTYYAFELRYISAYGGGYDQFITLGAYRIDSIADQTYTGSAITPTVSISSSSYSTYGMTEGDDYTVSYQNNVNVGTATVTVTGSGLYYVGSITQTFNIVKGSNSGTTSTGSGSNSGNTSGTNTSGTSSNSSSTVSVARGTITKLTVGKKRVKVTIKRITGVKGYQIRYSTKANMKGAKKVTVTSRTKTIKNLKKGKRYYFQVRAYKLNSSGTKVWGKWSVKKRSKKVK